MAKQATKSPNRWLFQNNITIFNLEWNTLRSKMDCVRSIMGSQDRIWPEMYPIKHEVCHFGPMLGPLRSGVGLSALVLILSGLGWILFGLKGAQLRVGPLACDDPSKA